MEIITGNFNDLDWEPLRRGMERKLFSGEGATVHITKVENNNEVKIHSHKYEQLVVILRGELDFIIGNKTYPMKAGSFAVIPPNVEHAAHCYKSPEPVLNLDVFIPRRVEYDEQYKKYLLEHKKSRAKEEEIYFT